MNVVHLSFDRDTFISRIFIENFIINDVIIVLQGRVARKNHYLKKFYADPFISGIENCVNAQIESFFQILLA